MTDEIFSNEEVKESHTDEADATPMDDLRFGMLCHIGQQLFGREVVERTIQDRGLDLDEMQRCMDAVSHTSNPEDVEDTQEHETDPPTGDNGTQDGTF